MSETDGIVGAIYRAALGRCAWTEPLDAIARLFDASSAHLMGLDARDRTLLFAHEGGDAPAAARLEYVRTWHRLDPRLRLVTSAPCGQWLHCHEHFDDAFVARDRFFQEFLLPYGQRYTSGLRFEASAGVVCLFGLTRAVGRAPFDARERGALQRLGGHVEAAMRLRAETIEDRASPAAGLALLGRLKHPLMVVDAERQVLFANDAARRLLERRPALAVRHGRLRLASRERDASLTQLLKLLEADGPASVPAPAPVPRDAVAERDAPRVLVLDQPPAAPLVAHFAPALPDETMGAFGARPVCLVTIFEAGQRDSIDPYVLQKVFDLTPAEARVTAELASGRRPETIAERTGVSVHTIRSQVRAALQKIGVAGQLELAALVAGNPAFWGGLMPPG